MKEKEVLLQDVLRWLQAAMEAAKADPGDAEDAFTALSYRELRVRINVGTGNVDVHVLTRNWGFAGNGEKVYHAITDDGVIVKWEERDRGIPTGADWLPEDFVNWMRGG